MTIFGIESEFSSSQAKYFKLATFQSLGIQYFYLLEKLEEFNFRHESLEMIYGPFPMHTKIHSISPLAFISDPVFPVMPVFLFPLPRSTDISRSRLSFACISFYTWPFLTSSVLRLLVHFCHF